MIQATAVPVESLFDEMPEIVNVSYDLSVLRITLLSPKCREPVYVEFDASGFRVLDEGQLLEFWEKSTRPAGWLWKIESGGWFELESSREGFLLGAFAGSNAPAEYFIGGINDCISVLTFNEPRVYRVQS